MKLAICGNGRAGKDTVCHIITRFTDLKYKESTSEAASQVVFDTIMATEGHFGMNIDGFTPGFCWANRHAHRELWRDIILDYNAPDGTRLYREMAKNNDLFNGIRCPEELNACLDSWIVDRAIWVERDGTVDPSNLIKKEDCHHVIENNGTKNELMDSVFAVLAKLEIPVKKKMIERVE